MGLTMQWSEQKEVTSSGDDEQKHRQRRDDTAEASLLSQILHASKCVLVHSFVLTM